MAVGRQYIEDHTEQLHKLCDNLVKYIELETKAITHEKAVEDTEVVIEVSLDLDNSSDDASIINKKAITVTSDDIANSNEDAARNTNKSHGDVLRCYYQ
ncbi:hypothetical protein [Rickettsia prowazekii]|uniref:hypothetical protein n=1 Tax=Rickettsia prowazekii TaxID=782 RepID=UPI00031232A7|nr:hypothetical protein [Rickettsia prowazekii]